MDIEFVKRKAVKTSKKRSSKYKPLMKALGELEVGGMAVRVPYRDEKEVSSMRTAVYNYNQENNVKIRSSKDAASRSLYFYKEK